MNVPLLDLKAQYKSIETEIDLAVKNVVESQYFIMGPEVKKFEKSVAEYCETEHAFGCASGSDALLLALMAIDLKPGEYVITTPFTFFATAGAISRLGAIPIFVDIDIKTFNIDANEIRSVLAGNHIASNRIGIDRDKIRAIIPVHLYGQMANMVEIMSIANEYDLVVVEDAAQSIGAQLNGKKAGKFGDFACFSFFPSKNLGAYGDAGLITVVEPELAEKVDILRLHGARPKYHNKYIGMNSRIDAIQAAILSVKLNYLDSWSTKRREKAHKYNQLFQEAGLSQEMPNCCEHSGKTECGIEVNKIVLPLEIQGNPETGGKHIYHQYTIRIHNRDAVMNQLKRKGVGTAVYYPVPMHLQECYSDLGYKSDDFPLTVCASNQALSLPIYPEITESQQQYVVEQIKNILHDHS